MPIAREGRFLVWPDMAHVEGLGLESSQLDDCVKAVKNRGLKGVFGNPGFGFQERSLDVLRELPGIEAIWFWDVDLENVEAIYALSALRYFGVHPKRPAVDFSKLPALTRLVWFHKPSDTGIASLTALEDLHVWHYRSKSKAFSDVNLPQGLTKLQINWANVETLNGLPNLPRLRCLEIHRCRNLRSLGNIAELFPQLEHLVVAACGRVDEGEGERVVRSLPSLRHAYVRDRLVRATRQ